MEIFGRNLERGFVVMAIIVRRASMHDARELADILNEIITRGGTTAYETEFSPQRLIEVFLTGTNLIGCFVAIDETTCALLGFQALTSSAEAIETGEVSTYVGVGKTKRGIGSTLFAATKMLARQTGLTSIDAVIRADNVGGLAFYEHLGFRSRSVKKGIPLADGTKVDRITKRLSIVPLSSPFEAHLQLG